MLYEHVVDASRARARNEQDQRDAQRLLVEPVAVLQRAMLEELLAVIGREEHHGVVSLTLAIAPPLLEGPEEAEVTLIGWGSTYGVIKEAVAQLDEKGISVNHLPIKWIVPLHAGAVTEIVNAAKRTIIVENNYSGQFYRYLRSETGLEIDGHIRKYDGEPFMPHHIVDAVVEQLAGETDHSVPVQEIMV